MSKIPLGRQPPPNETVTGWVAMVGDPFNGCELYGPFTTQEECYAYCDTHDYDNVVVGFILQAKAGTEFDDDDD